MITFVCYGTWLPGDHGAVERRNDPPGSPSRAPDPARRQAARNRMKQPRYELDAPRRQLVLESIQQVCQYRGWDLLAAHVRTNHVHLAVQADHAPEGVMNTVKAYASRALNRAGLDSPQRRRWARHGSIRYLWTKSEVAAAIHYVVSEQGEPMTVYEEAPR